jgi:hypothetical protein
MNDTDGFEGSPDHTAITQLLQRYAADIHIDVPALEASAVMAGQRLHRRTRAKRAWGGGIAALAVLALASAPALARINAADSSNPAHISSTTRHQRTDGKDHGSLICSSTDGTCKRRDGGPPDNPSPSEADTSWAAMPIRAMVHHLAADVPPGVTITDYTTAGGQLDATTSASDRGPGDLLATLQGSRPGSAATGLQVSLFASRLTDPQDFRCNADDWTPTAWRHMRCSTHREPRHVVERDATFTDAGITVRQVNLRVGDRYVYVGVANATGAKWTVPSGGVPALTMSDVRAIAAAFSRASR